MSDIFREVDEALNREKAAAFWKDYGPTFVGCVAIIILSTAATTGYMHWRTTHNRAETAKVIAAANNEADMIAALETAAQDIDGGHKAIALLNAGNKAAANKNFAKAQEIYGTLISDSGTPKDLRDLAAILSVRANILEAGDAAPDYKALVAKLDPIANNKSSAFYRQASLEAASLYGTGLKDYTKALDLLKGFVAENGSDSLKEKASALRHVYEYELSQSKQNQE